MVRRAGRGSLVLAMLVSILVAAVVRGRRPHEPEPANGPRRTSSRDYVSSEACRSCHPAEYDSWHRSYHRTMTQTARAELVRGPDADLEQDGRRYGIHRRGGEVWATLPDLRQSEGSFEARSRERRLELSTGSHHYQGYWFREGSSSELSMFPFVYLFTEHRWLPRRDVFLQPPDAPEQPVRWNASCIQCHATAGQPGHDPGSDRWDTQVDELGIACEACHGPAGEHVRHYRDPLARYRAYASDAGGELVVNPGRLPADRASMVCGQCHAFTYPKDEDEWWHRGYTRTYRPGEDLARSRFLIELGSNNASSTDTSVPVIDADPESMFWRDGTVRVGGREYSGMVASACFQRAPVPERRIGCMSCHSMHASEPAGQIARGRDGNLACRVCHTEGKYAEENLMSHTHHRRGSSGSLCSSCHMPKTTYALLRAIPSHRIDSPRVGDSSRPSACNLCHLDRSAAWTSKNLRAWYGQGASTADPATEGQDPAGPRWLLAGDAAQRVIVAAAFGAAQETVAGDWAAPLLLRALEDPYVAVRIVALRSLRALPGHEHFAFDPVAPPHPRLHADPLDTLVAKRDERPISISE